ncbi:MAG TPA: peptidoglycan DD-metalloendopeptidase family protein [Burkholderiaceae bacterium]|nr:peptidoglycan DD-metalloendopeptidase family protein [Burkholderiaceae bacterium]
MLRAVGRTGIIVGLGLVCGCTVVGLNEVPIVDRSVWAEKASVQRAEGSAVASDGLAASDSEFSGGYVVRPSDTLYSIALTVNQDVDDLARWNGIRDPSQLRVGQVLRVLPPAGEVASGVTVVDAPPVASQSIESRPLDGPPLTSASIAQGGDGAAPPAAAIVAPSAQTSPAQAAKSAQAQQTSWIWPAQGKVLQPFAEGKSKGIDIAGEEGDPVLAAQDGQVVYSGNSLKGFGNLIIIKHEGDFVSAYAHNRENKVAHGQTVKKGQLIAELGRTDTSSPKLHFEIRRKGKPVDPVSFLPARP